MLKLHSPPFLASAFYLVYSAAENSNPGPQACTESTLNTATPTPSSIFLQTYLSYFYVYEYFACAGVCALHVWWPEIRHQVPWRCWELNQSPLLEQ